MELKGKITGIAATSLLFQKPGHKASAVYNWYMPSEPGGKIHRNAPQMDREGAIIVLIGDADQPT